MEVHKYEWGKKMTGLYIDINGWGEAYNLLLLVQAYSKRSKRGTIKISNKPFKDAIKLELPPHYNIGSKHYWITDECMSGFQSHNVSLPFTKYKSKKLYLNVFPNQTQNRFQKSQIK